MSFICASLRLNRAPFPLLIFSYVFSLFRLRLCPRWVSTGFLSRRLERIASCFAVCVGFSLYASSRGSHFMWFLLSEPARAVFPDPLAPRVCILLVYPCGDLCMSSTPLASQLSPVCHPVVNTSSLFVFLFVSAPLLTLLVSPSNPSLSSQQELLAYLTYRELRNPCYALTDR